MDTAIDPVELTAKLVRCPSVTPEEAGAISLLERLLLSEGFDCHRIERGGISNLFARWGPKDSKSVFGFNGHTDVVPPGNPDEWSRDPFGAEISGGELWGRGAADMKSGVAAFVVASVEFARRHPEKGGIALTITGDEEAIAEDGTVAILDWMTENGERMDACLVAEPTCPEEFGEAMKIGRRGSLSVRIRIEGIQGHSAYPDRARNPVPAIARLADRLSSAELDRGTANFQPSTLSVTSIDTGNPASNVIPASCEATVNIRFNDSHDGQSLLDWLESETRKVETEFGVSATLQRTSFGDCFVTEPGELTELVADAVQRTLGRRPEMSTAGGTSDARFIKDHCPVVEFGLIGATIHQVDERVSTADIRTLTEVYFRILDGWHS